MDASMEYINFFIKSEMGYFRKNFIYNFSNYI